MSHRIHCSDECKEVAFLQHCITEHFERKQVDVIVKKLLGDHYKSGKYECHICNKPDL
jgi:hypothetical protein